MNQLTNSTWTKERVELLTRLWNEGLSVSSIMIQLGVKSRNMVIGKANRLGLGPRKQTPESISEGMRRGKPLPALKAPKKLAFVGGWRALKTGPKKPPHLPTLTEDQKEYICGKGIPLLELASSHCRWPINEPPKGGEYLFCGAKKMEGSSYCEFHSSKAWGKTAGRDIGL